VDGWRRVVDKKKWIKVLGLKRHPEGGYFKESYRASTKVHAQGFDGKRSASTAIYYLLESGQFSAFHRIKSDEIWHFYAGSPLTIHVLDKEGRYKKVTMGGNRRLLQRTSQSFQAVVKSGCWFSASVDRRYSYSLVGCTVAPGFDFRDWETGKRGELVALYPKHKQIIEKFTRDTIK
jgi:predicted cupin superfamily sugar epimerase